MPLHGSIPSTTNTSGVQFISAPGERYGTLLPAATANYVNPKLGPGRKDPPYVFPLLRIALSHARISASVRPSGVLRRRRRPGAARLSVPRPQKWPKVPHQPILRHSELLSQTWTQTYAQRHLCRFPACRSHRQRAAFRAKTSTEAAVAAKVAPADEKGHFRFTDEKGVEPVERHYPGDKRGTRDALRTTARVLGRSIHDGQGAPLTRATARS
jgi:hypothetical protein